MAITKTASREGWAPSTTEIVMNMIETVNNAIGFEPKMWDDFNFYHDGSIVIGYAGDERVSIRIFRDESVEIRIGTEIFTSGSGFVAGKPLGDRLRSIIGEN